MIHYVNGVEPGGERDPVTICGYESRYDQILETALNEYADVPCSDCYRDGYNLALRMKDSVHSIDCTDDDRIIKAARIIPDSN